MRKLLNLLGAALAVSGIAGFVFPQATRRFWNEGAGTALPGPLSTVVRSVTNAALGSRALTVAEAGLGGLLLWFSLQGRGEPHRGSRC